MRAGTLRHRVSIERRVTTRSATGATVEAYEVFLPRIQAHVLPADQGASGNEAWGSAQVQGTVDTKIRIRKRPGLNITMRVRHHHGSGSPTTDDVYDIAAIAPADTPTTELVLWCRLREGQGFRSDGT